MISQATQPLLSNVLVLSGKVDTDQRFLQCQLRTHHINFLRTACESAFCTLLRLFGTIGIDLIQIGRAHV